MTSKVVLFCIGIGAVYLGCFTILFFINLIVINPPLSTPLTRFFPMSMGMLKKQQRCCRFFD